MSSEFDGLERELAEIDEEEGKRMPTKAARLLPMMVAAVALLSFGAIIYYAYNRGLTTGTEVAAPLITPEGPAKVKPADPGGLEVPHRDKLVYGALDKSADDSRVEQLLPPPEDPMRPPAGTTARQAGTELIPRREVPVPSVTGADGQADEPALPVPELGLPSGPPPQAGAEDAPAPEPAPTTRVSSAIGPLGSQGETTASAAATAKAPEPATEQTVVEDLKPANGKQTEGPKAATTPAAAKSPAEPPKQVAKAAAAPAKTQTPAAGAGWRIQIASLRSAESARTEWQRQQKAHAALLGELDLTVKRVDLAGKGTYFRVQAGPLKDKAAAQGLCTALKQKKVGCLIVRP